ncbi:protein maelstrom homolog [Vanessa cardui]|uniref:protein maelstrom homolog n=1 Tax=Vanessa cardui TaxID=171605 RepID=UPI001F13D741|nr:protein maelstrom homolog [Vanessa cardui]
MPKKPPRNAFYFYMLDFKEEQRKKGVNYKNLAEVAEAAGPSWRDAPPSIRSKFEGIAKKEKQKFNIPDTKFTSTGIPLSVIEQAERDVREAEEIERKDIKNLVNLRAFNNSIKTLDIYLMDVNYYCKAGSDYIIGESTLLRFNIQDGIKDTYHEIINPRDIPLGYTSEVKIGSQTYGLEMPDDSAPRSNYMQILANIIDYLKQVDHRAKVLPPIFTMPDKVEPVQNFIHQMCRRAGEDEALFRIYKFDILFFTIMNALKTQPDEGFPKESLALLQLKKDSFKYTPGIACEHHERSDMSVECSQSRAKRWAYTALDSCCPAADVPARAAAHVPPDYDLDSIHVFKEQKKVRHAPSVAGYAQAMSSCNSSMTSDSFFDTTINSSVDSTKKEKRVHVPLRMPKADYSQAIRVAPELTEADFPSLGQRPGRGRGLGGSFSKLKLDK